MKKLSTEEYKEQIKDNSVICVEEYQGSQTKIDHQCKKCNYIWKVSPDSIKSQHGCPKCAGKYSPTAEEYKEQIKDKSVICVGDYANASTKIDHQCKTCGHIWKVLPKSIKSGHICPKCAAKKQTFSTKEYKEQIKDKTVICLGKYKNRGTKIDHQCKVCDYIWKIAPSKVKKGQGCPKCDKQYSPSTQEYKRQIRDKHIICIEEYINAKTKINHQCKKCGYIWKVTPGHIKDGSGCPKCAILKSTFTTQEYKEQIKDKSVICLGEYKNTDTKIKHQCKKCNNVWKTTPSSIKRGRACPICANLKSKTQKYKNKPTTFYLIQLKDGVKPGLTQTSIYERYRYDKTIFYEILEEIHFQDGIDAVKLEDDILYTTKQWQTYRYNKSGPLTVGNTEIRDIQSLPFIFDIINNTKISKLS